MPDADSQGLSYHGHLFGLERGRACRGGGGGRAAGVFLEDASLIQAVLPGGGQGGAPG